VCWVAGPLTQPSSDFTEIDIIIALLRKSVVTMTNINSLKIVMVHNYYQYRGGEDTATESLVTMLGGLGHKVTLLTENNDRINNFNKQEKLELFLNTSWNKKAEQQLRSQLSTLKPDLLHVHNFFPLFSPGIHSAAKSLNIPTIQHLHNFRLGCLNGYLYRQQNICELCVGNNPWRGVMYRCYRNSLPASLAVWNMITFNRWHQTWLTDVDTFIAPSRFAAEKLIQIGIPSNRLHIHPNLILDPLPNQTCPPLPEIPTFLYVGRLSPEKGVIKLLEAWQKLNQPQWQLQIVGDGPEKANLEDFSREKQLINVHFTGYQSQSGVIAAIKQATVIIVPSQWYETFGRVVIEAFACGRTVLVSNLGALTELVTEGETGFLLNPDELTTWVERLKWCGENPAAIQRMGQKARQSYLANYSLEVNYQQLLAIYQTVLN
jgi:glycosyltransferase involved in cell wall biosynthesis